MWMIMISDYVKPKSIEEAYDLLVSNDNAQIIGGGAFIKLTSKKIDLAIDLYNTNLNFVNDTETSIEIGAMTTFRDIEKSETIKKHFGNILSDSVKDIVGVQFKNYVTVGGSVYPKYGFSDLITALLALDCRVVLYNSGEKSLEDFLKEKTTKKDILTKIILNKGNIKAAFKTIRNSSGDYSALNVAVSKNESKYKIAVGARPGVATLALESMEILNSMEGVDENVILKAAEMSGGCLSFGSNHIASAEYRKDLCSVLVKRAVMEVVR
jgi:CO/xanthine dehydrogenase FAD-binding subunit